MPFDNVCSLFAFNEFEYGNKLKEQLVVVAGGVAANTILRDRLKKMAEEKSFNVSYPSIEFCTDNAAMIAMAGSIRWHNQMGNQPLNTEVDINPSLELGSGY